MDIKSCRGRVFFAEDSCVEMGGSAGCCSSADNQSRQPKQSPCCWTRMGTTGTEPHFSCYARVCPRPEHGADGHTIDRIIPGFSEMFYYFIQIRSDWDGNQNMFYFLLGHGATEEPVNLFVVDGRTGEVRVRGKLDREERETYTVSTQQNTLCGVVITV